LAYRGWPAALRGWFWRHRYFIRGIHTDTGSGGTAILFAGDRPLEACGTEPGRVGAARPCRAGSRHIHRVGDRTRHHRGSDSREGGAVSGLSQSAKISTRFSSGVSYHGGDAVHIRQSPRERIQCKHARPDGQDRTLVFACFSAVSYCGGADHAPPSSIRNRISISC
jgi:hypothetical protein